MKILLKLIPKQVIIKAVWSIIRPILLKKVLESNNPIDDKVFEELEKIIEELTEV